MAGVPLDKYAKHRDALLADKDNWDLTNRPAMLPFLGEYTNKNTGEKSGGFAWPSMVTEPVNAYKRLTDAMRGDNGELTLPNPQNPDNQRDMVTALLGLYGGNALNPLAKVPAGALGANSIKASGGIKAARGNNQTPFYGEHVGPKGQIADPAAAVDSLGLRSGVVGAPTDGFFNPATSALLQQGVQPKQTLAYYQKQMGSRGGKLPPGMWERATQGLTPDQTTTRDEIVRRLDELAPQIQRQKYTETEQVYEGAIDSAQYQNWSTPGQFQNYSETAVGYPMPSWAGGGNGKNVVGQFRDNHFENNLNLEGWYRTQDADASRILEEVQPQRYQKRRYLGESVSPEQMERWREENAKATRKSEALWEQAINDFGIKPEAEGPPWARFDVAKANLERISYGTIPGDKAKALDILDKQNTMQNNIKHLWSQINAAQDGVNPSPYSHDVNAATDHLLKNAFRDAADDGIDRMAWPPGETQLDRFDGLSDNTGMDGYYGSGPHGDGGILTDRVQSLVKRLTGEKPEIQPQTFQTAKGDVQYPSVHLTPEMLAAVRQKGLPLFSNAAPWLTALGIAASEMFPDDENTF